MKEKDIIEIDYVAKIKKTAEVFDLTSEAKAKQLNIYNKNYSYHPLIIILGQGFILKSLEDKILKINEKNIGKEFKFAFEPKDAFGERSSKLIQTMPLAYFKGKDLKIGELIEFENEKKQKQRGKVISISSGRVCVDFNNVLAGKTVEYELVVNKIFKTKPDKLNAIIKMFIPENFEGIECQINQKTATISIPNKLDNVVVKQLIAKYADLCIDEINEVKFIQTFKNLGDNKNKSNSSSNNN